MDVHEFLGEGQGLGEDGGVRLLHLQYFFIYLLIGLFLVIIVERGAPIPERAVGVTRAHRPDVISFS